jgi:hypothetical protein
MSNFPHAELNRTFQSTGEFPDRFTSDDRQVDHFQAWPFRAYHRLMEEILHADLRRRVYGLAAEIRAVEEGHNARVMPDGSILVKAESHPGSYRVFIRGIDDAILWFGCSCRSGEYRASLPVPCKHAALAARRLEREGLARWDGGVWRLREHAQVRGARLLLARSVHRRPRVAAPPIVEAA